MKTRALIVLPIVALLGACNTTGPGPVPPSPISVLPDSIKSAVLATCGVVLTAQSLSQLKIQYGELSREYERAKTEHEALMKKRETTDRQLERQRTSAEARYDIITPPTAAKASLVSALVKRGGMGLMVGFSLALLAAAYLEVRRILIMRGHI